MTALAFHLAAPVLDKETTRAFYQDLLGCDVGREADTWIDFDFFGHQASFHVKPDEIAAVKTNVVDEKRVPVRHFGAILKWEDWHMLVSRLERVGTKFMIAPYIRFEGEIGEQATFFLLDPSGNALEFKAFKDPNTIFAR